MAKDSLPYRRCYVTKDYQSSNPDPMMIQAGEPFHVSEKTDCWDNNSDWLWVWCTDQRGKSAWVPKTIIHMDRDGKIGATNYPYDATELTVTVGDELTCRVVVFRRGLVPGKGMPRSCEESQ